MDAVAGVDLGETVQDERRPMSVLPLSGDCVEPGQFFGSAGEILALQVPALGAEEVTVTALVFPVGVFLDFSHRVFDLQDLVIGEFVVGVADAAEFAEQFVGAVDGPGDLVFLGAVVAVGAGDEVEARPGWDLPQYLRFRQVQDRLEFLFEVFGHV